MPMILRVTPDMFQFADVMDYMTIPVNLMGAPGAGLALEFRRRIPDHLFFEPYRAACRSKELRIGTIQILEDTDQHWGLVVFPSKRHYADTSDKEDIVRGLEALRDTLKSEQYRYASIGMPMLGCGLGAQDYEVVYPLMIDHLADLDATVFLSMAPQRTEMRPKYLVIVGPPDFGLTDEDRKVIDETVDKIMTAWGTNLSDYTAIVSGGYPGVDSYIAGEHNDGDYSDTFTYKRTQGKPLVVKPNKVRNGVGANLLHNNLLCEIADDIILFKPVGHNNNRLSQMQVWLKEDKPKRHADGHDPRRVAVFGEHEPEMSKEKLFIPVNIKDDD